METNLFNSCVLMPLSIHVAGNSAKGDLGEIETSADKDLLKLSKKLLDCPEYEAVKLAAQEIRKAIKRKCFGGVSKSINLPNGRKATVGKGITALVKPGVYLVPLEKVEEVQDLLERLIPEFNQSVTRFVDVYPTRLEETLVRLGGQGQRMDYPTAEKVKRACYVEYSYVSVGVPQALEGVRASLFAQEREKAAAKWADATEEIRQVLRFSMKELVDHMMDRLAPGEGGKKKIFHESMITKLKNFVDDFQGKNLTKDGELDSLVQKARDIMAGKTVDDLRENTDIRADVKEKLTAVKAELDRMVEDAPTRMITLVEEEEAVA